MNPTERRPPDFRTMVESSADETAFWSEVAEAFHAFARINDPATILVGIALERPKDEAVRLIVDQVSLLLARWRDRGEERAVVCGSHWLGRRRGRRWR